MDKRYTLHVRIDDSVYTVVLADGIDSLSEEDALEHVKELTGLEYFGTFVFHEPTGEEFYIGVPAPKMKDILFFAKEKK